MSIRFVSNLLAVVATLFVGCARTPYPVKMCILPGDWPDPSIIRDGRDFYMTHSSLSNSPGLLIWHSRDLVNWKPVCRPLREAPGNVWAPELCKVGDTYYIYFPTDRRENYVISATSIEGPWSEPVPLGVSGFDPGLVVDTDGTRYLYFNRGRAVRLSPDGLSAVGEMFKVYDGWPYPEEWETACWCLESPKLLKRGEWFYLICAEGGTDGPPTSHMCVVARSRSALGPWENSPYNPLVHTWSESEPWWSKGHGTLIDDASGRWYIVYHGYLNGFRTLGRSTLLESVEWTDDHWPVLTEKDGASFRKKGFTGNYAALRDARNQLLWSRWGGEFEGGALYTMAAVDTSYSISATFTIGENAAAGAYLFYNENAFFGKKVTTPGTHSIRIVNCSNWADLWYKEADGDWVKVSEGVDVSELHHNRLRGFSSLRPAYLLQGDATLDSFDYARQAGDALAF